jgi:hypothetical protein
MPRLRNTAAWLILGGSMLGAVAAAPELKVLGVGAHSISLAWDSAWQISPPGAVPPGAAEFHAANPHDMTVMITADARPSANADVDGYLRSVIGKAVKNFQQSSDEKLEARAFSQGGTRGYSVCATDRAPKPEEYEYVCQGIATNGEVAVVFTVLYNEAGKQSAEKATAALEALQFTARA